jgi:hypothetical protein
MRLHGDMRVVGANAGNIALPLQKQSQVVMG